MRCRVTRKSRQDGFGICNFRIDDVFQFICSGKESADAPFSGNVRLQRIYARAWQSVCLYASLGVDGPRIRTRDAVGIAIEVEEGGSGGVRAERLPGRLEVLVVAGHPRDAQLVKAALVAAHGDGRRDLPQGERRLAVEAGQPCRRPRLSVAVDEEGKITSGPSLAVLYIPSGGEVNPLLQNPH